MKVVEINSTIKGSTGGIMLRIAENVRAAGDEVYTFSEIRKGVEAPLGHSFFGCRLENLAHRAYSVLTGISGTGSRRGTKKLLQALDNIKPDIIHLHNLHGWYINIPMLFDYIRQNQIKTVWTLHDCWAFTAQCSHFTMEKCEKWKTGCYDCPRYRKYPYTLVDRTDRMWPLKKRWFSGIKNLTIVTPSKWLADLVAQSFLKDYDVKVINNGIDLEIFKPTPSNFREKHGLQNKKIILGASTSWGYAKGLDTFASLAKILPDEYKIVLVGTTDKIDKDLPKNILSIHRTDSPRELAEIYTAADVFVNPTREDTFPTVNIEAIACGLGVVTFCTGGSPESVTDETGIVVEYNNLEELEKAVILACQSDRLNKVECIENAQQYSAKEKFVEYVRLFKKIMRKENS